MARIRTIKPEFWSDEKLALMRVETRMLFLALISMADDCGRLVDSMAQIVAFVYPFRDDPEDFANLSRDVRESLAQLSEAGRIARGDTGSGQRIIQIVNWERHQKVDHPNLKAALPKIVTPQRVTKSRERLANVARKPRENGARDSRLDLRPTTSTNDLRPVPVPRSPDADAPAPETAWLSPYLDLWTRRIGVVPPKRAAAALAPVRAIFGDTETMLGLTAYVEEERPPDKPARLEYFAADAARWIAEARIPLQNPDGTLTARGERLTRPVQ